MAAEPESGDTTRFDEFIDRFEHAWRVDQRPSLGRFIAEIPDQESDQSQALIQELVLIDLEWQWRTGGDSPPLLEEYLKQAPQLGTTDTLPIALVVEEYRVRHNWGDRPSHEEFQRRFPHLSSDLPDVLGRVDQELARELRKQAPDVPERLGRYQILQQVGSGGFGVVYRARDEELSRDVAIKVPYQESVSTHEDAEQFLTEARTIAGLDHPGVVPVYDMGRTDDGICYVVTKYIDGSELTAKIVPKTRTYQDVARIIASVAEALHHAHLRGITHRDIKPANILLDSDGNAYVTDFGLAVRDADLTVDRRLAGTPAYMSPEQARGEGHRLDGRTDIFSLGVVLYELLTGQKPFPGDSTREVLKMVKHVEPRPPRQYDDKIPRELDRICLRALSKRVGDRYSTAADMAEDIRQWQMTSGTEKLAVVAAAEVSPTRTAWSTSELRQGSANQEKTLVHEFEQRVIPKGLRSFDAEDADFFLELLPGPRGRDGLPDSIRFWKTRIESTVPEQSFTVGMLYGPSGCGKSSLVKAGLLPSLLPHVATVYIEAAAHETEARLVAAIQHRVPSVSSQANLAETIAFARRAKLENGRKLLIVVDQFEQWLQAYPSAGGEMLVDALRQCDGTHVQCLLLVRDDFWLSSCRFMDALEIELQIGHNVAVADLFDKTHARQVLSRFGQAYGRLPIDVSEWSAEQVAFVEAAVDGLARDERVVCVRLALFADLVKGKSWEPGTLAQYGGMHGLGVTFLEECFTLRTAMPKHRLHEMGARAVLKSLLPEHGTDIKGAMRSYQQLLEISGYHAARTDFDSLLRVLDSDLRLITPTDAPDSDRKVEPKGALPGPQGDTNSGGDFYYQLTHDYLVPSLREWLTRKQQETMRGRAALRLVERTSVWSDKPQTRNLPAWWEWLSIRLLTVRANWTGAERRMMGAAFRHHSVRASLLVAALFAVGVLVFQWNSRREAQHLVNRLLEAKTSEVSQIVGDMDAYRRHVNPMLESVLHNVSDGVDIRNRALHASLALLPVDDRQIEYLYQRLLLASPDQLPAIFAALRPYRRRLTEQLWGELSAPGDAVATARLNSSIALAEFDPPMTESSESLWRQTSERIVKDTLDRMVASPGHYGFLRDSLFAARRPLVDSLISTLNGQADARRSHFAINLLADYCVDEPSRLTDLAMGASGEQFQVLLRSLAPHQDDVTKRFEAELASIVKELQQAGLTEIEKDAIAKRGAVAAIGLLQLGSDEATWSLLQQDQPDPRLRTYLIENVQPFGVAPQLLSDRFTAEQDVRVRRALIAALGNYADLGLSAADVGLDVDELLRIFREETDSGQHSVVKWLLEKWNCGERIRQIEQELASVDPRPGFDWWVNKEGHTMAVLRGPMEFTMGSPDDEPDRVAPFESRSRQEIPYDFAIATNEVTIEQFLKFTRAVTGSDEKFKFKGLVKDISESPYMMMTWYQAAEYCDWLSIQHGLQPCYERNDDGKYAEGMRIPVDLVRRTGYRLPMEAEWEYACRAMTTTSRYYGQDRTLIDRYEWCRENADDYVWPVGTLKPNGIGLFDMLGNVQEWCNDRFGGADAHDKPVELLNHVRRAYRGGSIDRTARMCRSAFHHGEAPHRNASVLGFRVVRTIGP